MKRYPFGPLARLMRCSEHQACEQLQISGSTAQQYRRIGVSAQVADRLAVRAGLVPYEVWPDYLDELMRPCDECTTAFVPMRVDARFCSPLCYRRWWQREVQRRRRARPELAERNRVRRRAYYAENGEYERARERRAYQLRKETSDA